MTSKKNESVEEKAEETKPVQPTGKEPSDTVSRDEFDAVTRKLDEVTRLLIQTADANKLAKATFVAPKTGTRGRVSLNGGKPIVSWKLLEDVVVPGKMERQIVEVAMLDGTTDKLEYSRFAKRMTIGCDILSRTVDAADRTTLKLKLDDGTEMEIDQTYIN